MSQHSSEVQITATDPVCGMQIDPSRAAGRAEYAGATFYFCSQSCAAKFQSDPAHYVHPDSNEIRKE